MKKIIRFFVPILLMLCLNSCSFDNFVVASLPKYESKDFYTSGGWQDFTDYAKYTYDDISEKQVSKSRYFKKIATDTDIDMILNYIDDFEGWVETCGGELKENYDFDKTVICQDGYFYIKSGSTLNNYDVYYFDLDKSILYFFHNNI